MPRSRQIAPRRAAIVGSGLLAVLALVAAGRARAADPPAATAATPSPTPDGPAKFDHAAHARRTPAVAIDQCGDCHRSGKDGALTAPAALGHQPCLRSGCHVDDFLASGTRAAKADPERFSRATRFCRGCHGGAPNTAPGRATKPALAGLWKDNAAPGHHVEMDHFAHTARTACRSCHVVDATTFALVTGAPGHAQCAACHGTSQPDPDMNACKACHAEPGPAAYFGAPRAVSDVRSCGTPEHAALKTADGGPAPCFKHERPEHRGGSGSQAMQCGACHFMVSDKAAWGKLSYRSLKDMAAAPVIHNDRDRAHRACGAAGCHGKDVDDSRGKANCKLCHSNKVVVESIFD